MVLISLSVRLGASGYDGFYVESLKVSSQRGECGDSNPRLETSRRFWRALVFAQIVPEILFLTL